MPMLNDLQQDLANLRSERDSAAGEARTLSFRAQALRTQLSRLKRSAGQDDQLGGIEQEIADLDAEVKATRERARGIDAAMGDRASGLLQVPIDDLVAQLD